MTLAEEKVAAGVAVLDEKVPGWWQVIDLDSLKMSDCSHCMLGQLFGYDAEKAIGAAMFGLPQDIIPDLGTYLGYINSGYLRGCRALGVEGEDIGCCSIDEDEEEDLEGVNYDDLKCAWAEVIAERRAAEGEHTDATSK